MMRRTSPGLFRIIASRVDRRMSSARSMARATTSRVSWERCRRRFPTPAASRRTPPARHRATARRRVRLLLLASATATALRRSRGRRNRHRTKPRPHREVGNPPVLRIALLGGSGYRLTRSSEWSRRAAANSPAISRDTRLPSARSSPGLQLVPRDSTARRSRRRR